MSMIIYASTMRGNLASSQSKPSGLLLAGEIMRVCLHLPQEQANSKINENAISLETGGKQKSKMREKTKQNKSPKSNFQSLKNYWRFEFELLAPPCQHRAISGLKSLSAWANHNLQCGPAIWQAVGLFFFFFGLDPELASWPATEMGVRVTKRRIMAHGSCGAGNCCHRRALWGSASCASCQWTCMHLIDLYCAGWLMYLWIYGKSA